MTPTDPRHGTEAGCREHYRDDEKPCPPCLEDHRRRNVMRRLYPHKRPALGSQRRIQALQAIGYGRDRIAAELGYTNGGSIAYLMRSDSLLSTTAERIADVYDRLSMIVPVGTGPKRARTWAKRHGYLPPLAWNDIDHDDGPVVAESTVAQQDQVDHAVVLRVIAGEQRPRRLTRAESTEVVRVLLARGLSTHRIENDYGLKVERYHRVGKVA